MNINYIREPYIDTVILRSSNIDNLWFLVKKFRSYGYEPLGKIKAFVFDALEQEMIRYEYNFNSYLDSRNGA